MVAGEAETLILRFKETVAGVRVPRDITGITFKAEVRRAKRNSGAPEVAVTATITDGPNGELTLSMTALQTATLVACPGGYTWGLLEDGSTIIAGAVPVEYSPVHV